jgi:YbbR domain-containing protein
MFTIIISFLLDFFVYLVTNTIKIFICVKKNELVVHIPIKHLNDPDNLLISLQSNVYNLHFKGWRSVRLKDPGLNLTNLFNRFHL